MTTLTLQTNPEANSAENLLQVLRRQEAAIRSDPVNAEHRWALVETLCLLCQWERALQQLQAWVRLEPRGGAQAQALRGLIQAEAQRVQVFSGQHPPAPVIETTPWMGLLWQALQHNVQGDLAQADDLRLQALGTAPIRAGQCQWQTRSQGEQDTQLQTQAFDWLADSDTRLGPVCEMMVAGAYRWLPFADIAAISLSAPQRRLDLVWLPAKLSLNADPSAAPEGAPERVLHVFIPARSCWTQPVAEPDVQQQALLQAHLTLWQEHGATGVFSQGQKTWMSHGIDWPVLDVREVQS